MRLDTATIYQIFWLSHQGIPKAQIARSLGVARNTVSWHLTGRLIPQYPERLQNRVRQLTIPEPKHKQPPKDTITLPEASYFFLNRPTARTIMSHYPIRTEIRNGITVTKPEWARECALRKTPTPPTGIFVTADAAEKLYAHSSQKRIVRIAEIPTATATVPASVVHAAVGIMTWTGMPYLTINMLDVMVWTTEPRREY
jgi:hypothetical protein